MQNIRKIISRYMQIVAIVMVCIILVIAIIVQILNEQRRARANAQDMFGSMEKILERNQIDIEETEEEYTQTCLHNAEAIAYMIQYHPEVLDSVEELKKIAEFLEVDEIHIFDKTGRIFTGTHPEYYDFTFDSGEQMMFFKPMLEDKSLELCQEITPNTAEGKLMQYSALWSEDEEFIVQVGMQPVNVTKLTEKNELSYIFSLLRVSSEVSYYAIDMENGRVVGSTEAVTLGKQAEEIGLFLEEIEKYGNGFYAKVNGVDSYCVFKPVGSNLIGRIVASDVLYKRISVTTAGLMVCLILLAIILVVIVTGYMNHYVIDGIYSVNEKLRAITKGDLNETVEVQTSVEFSELSAHINELVRSLLANTEKISYILNKTDLKIGVYEYYRYAQSVRFTEYISELLNVENENGGKLSMESSRFKQLMERLRLTPIPEEEGIYLLSGEKEQYIKIEEICQNNDIYGVVVDVTEDIELRRKIESERDIDLLTGLYNRRGMEGQLEELFQQPDDLGYGALIMVDADGLKEINDKYGHEKGDIYLKKIADVLSSFGVKSGIAARWGGDEFILFLYQYDSENELIDSMKTLKYLQHNSAAYLSSDVSVPLKFSFGYSLIKGETDYQELLKLADENMYQNKRQRKSGTERR